MNLQPYYVTAVVADGIRISPGRPTSRLSFSQIWVPRFWLESSNDRTCGSRSQTRNWSIFPARRTSWTAPGCHLSGFEEFGEIVPPVRGGMTLAIRQSRKSRTSNGILWRRFHPRASSCYARPAYGRFEAKRRCVPFGRPTEISQYNFLISSAP